MIVAQVAVLKHASVSKEDSFLISGTSRDYSPALALRNVGNDAATARIGASHFLRAID